MKNFVEDENLLGLVDFDQMSFEDSHGRNK